MLGTWGMGTFGCCWARFGTREPSGHVFHGKCEQIESDLWYRQTENTPLDMTCVFESHHP